MGTVRGVFPASSTPKKMAADKSRENYLKSRGESQGMLGRDASSADRRLSECGGVFCVCVGRGPGPFVPIAFVGRPASTVVFHKEGKATNSQAFSSKRIMPVCAGMNVQGEGAP